MLQALLAERFKLAVHRQTKEIPALILTVGKNGHKLQPVETEGSPSFKTGKLSLTGQGATIGQLTEFLSRELRNPVIDQTGLSGRFNYFLDIGSYVTEEMRKSQGPDGGPPPDAAGVVAQAIQAQLGSQTGLQKGAGGNAAHRSRREGADGELKFLTGWCATAPSMRYSDRPRQTSRAR